VNHSKLGCAILGAVAALMLPGSFQAAENTPSGVQAGAPPAAAARDLFVTVGKSLVVESPVNIQRISVGDAKKAEALAVTPREVLVNGKEAGETSLIIWQAGGNRLLFDLRVRAGTERLEVVRQQIEKELPGQEVSLAQEGESVFVRGTVNDMSSADRAIAIAEALGKPVNLLRVKLPAAQQQILLKVKFIDIDRNVTQQLGWNGVSTGAQNTVGSITTGQFQPPSMSQLQQTGPLGMTGGTLTQQWQLASLGNIFLWRPNQNIFATIQALQSRGLTQILAEPNLLTMDGKAASFLAGGEIPIPVVESAAGGLGQVSIMWKEFGVRINFVPIITPRKTIRLRVAPEVSSLDPADGITLSGFAVPALSVRRMQTEIELEDGQSFAIGGLLDNRTTETLSKIPGLGDIPVLGKLFQSRSRNKTNNELLVLVTPELVRPIPAGQPLPDIKLPQLPMKESDKEAPRTPPMSVTGPVPVPALTEAVPVEQLKALEKAGQAPPAAAPTIQLLALPQAPAPQANSGTMTTPLPTPSTPAP
jgi:pilus assembly protein CpaC